MIDHRAEPWAQRVDSPPLQRIIPRSQILMEFVQLNSKLLRLINPFPLLPSLFEMRVSIDYLIPLLPLTF